MLAALDASAEAAAYGGANPAGHEAWSTVMPTLTPETIREALADVAELLARDLEGRQKRITVPRRRAGRRAGLSRRQRHGDPGPGRTCSYDRAAPVPRLHDPQANLDHPIDWADWIQAGDSIAESTWSASPTGLTIGTTGIAGTVTSAWVRAGSPARLTPLTNHIVLTSGREDDRSIELICVDR